MGLGIWRGLSAGIVVLGALAAGLLLLKTDSGEHPDPRRPGGRAATADVVPILRAECPEPPPVEIPEHGPGRREFGAHQAFESDSELWIFAEVEVIIPRVVGSPSYGKYQLALHAFVLDEHGLKAAYQMPPTLLANSNVTTFFPYRGRLFAYQDRCLYQWARCDFERVPRNEEISHQQELGISGSPEAGSIRYQLLRTTEKAGFRRIENENLGPFSTEILSDRHRMRVRFAPEDAPNQIVAESLDERAPWREVILEIDPEWNE